MSKFRIDILWPSGEISKGDKTGDAIVIGGSSGDWAEGNCWWLLDGDKEVMGWMPNFKKGLPQTIIRIV
jgi:hypothetical protein